MKIVFFGSDDFAEAHLRVLLDSSHEVVACITQPDKPRDRGMKITMSPIKIVAQEKDIPVFQPAKLKDNPEIVAQLKSVSADVFVVIAYGRFLTQEILDLVSEGAINVHGSLLPKYRGAAPINWAIINGEKETGVSIFRLNIGMDAGDVLQKQTIEILDSDTSVILREKMKDVGCSLLLDTLDNLSQLEPIIQDQSQVSFAPKLTKEMGRIDWDNSAQHIHDLVRGLLPWPSAYTLWKGKQLKILESEVFDISTHNEQSARVVSFNDQGFVVTAKQGSLLVKKVQIEGKKAMDSLSFARGRDLEIGSALG